MSANQLDAVDARHFRNVLGQLPTGVVAITARSAVDGSPVGMTLGSFTSVSLDPPLVAFLPDRSSSTFPHIREAGKFCANILSSNQKEVSRTFATRGVDRFAALDWRPAPHTESPIIEGSLAWIDCEIVQIHEAGDHDIVIGRVLELQTQTTGFPLVYFQGGYGTFTLRSLVLATSGNLNASVRLAEVLRPELEQISAEFGVECSVFAHERDDLIVIMTTGYQGPADRVGMIVPFCPPFGFSFAAWGDREARDSWYDALPGGVSEDQRAVLEDRLNRIREQGWNVAYSNDPLNTVGKILETIAEIGSTPALERELVTAGQELTADLGNFRPLDAANVNLVRSVTAPVLDKDGTPALHLVLRGFPSGSDVTTVERARERLLEAARKVRGVES